MNLHPATLELRNAELYDYRSPDAFKKALLSAGQKSFLIDITAGVEAEDEVTWIW